MLINWFTVGAQALNFLLLVFLLRHFLYKPILKALDEREKKIAGELADAAARQAEAKKERDEFQAKTADLDQHRQALLAKAVEAAEVERKRLVGEARKSADVLSAKRQEALKKDVHDLNQALALRAQHEVFAIARKVLKDLATTSLEERLGEVFTRRLREMAPPAKAELVRAHGRATGPALVRSAFELPPDQRAIIQNALNETLSAEVSLRFESAPDLVCGIEFTTEGQKVAWSISEYLSLLAKGVDQVMKEQAPPPAAKPPEAKPAEEKPAEEKPAEEKPAEEKPADAKAAPAEAAAAEAAAEAAEAQAVEAKAAANAADAKAVDARAAAREAAAKVADADATKADATKAKAAAAKPSDAKPAAAKPAAAKSAPSEPAAQKLVDAKSADGKPPTPSASTSAPATPSASAPPPAEPKR